MSSRVEIESRSGHSVYRLLDDESGASASILPSYGFNLFDLRLPAAGEVRPIIYAAETFPESPSNPGRNGIPILFPFPNRIRLGRFTFDGIDYQLPLNKPPHAIHGFAIDAPWEVVDRGEAADGAFVVGRFQITSQARTFIEHWPADAVLEIRYSLKGRRLLMDVMVRNPDDRALPWGFGIHPYFRCPFPPGTDLDQTAVILPASKFWVLEQNLPTGEVRPVEPRIDFRGGLPIRGLTLDEVLTGLTFDADGTAACRLVDQTLRAEFRLRFGPPIRELVVFTPPSPVGVIAVEPYTQTTDAINLQAQGIDAGLQVLQPGGVVQFQMEMETVGS